MCGAELVQWARDFTIIDPKKKNLTPAHFLQYFYNVLISVTTCAMMSFKPKSPPLFPAVPPLYGVVPKSNPPPLEIFLFPPPCQKSSRETPAQAVQTYKFFMDMTILNCGLLDLKLITSLAIPISLRMKIEYA